MPEIVHTATVFKTGGSAAVTLPAWFRRHLNLEVGDQLVFTIPQDYSGEIAVRIHKLYTTKEVK